MQLWVGLCVGVCVVLLVSSSITAEDKTFRAEKLRIMCAQTQLHSRVKNLLCVERLQGRPALCLCIFTALSCFHIATPVRRVSLVGW